MTHPEGGPPRPADPRRWEDVFTVLSLQRFAPLFPDLGLPSALAAAPDGVAGCARAVLDQGPGSAAPEETARRVESFFHCVGAHHGPGVAEALRSWCLRFVVDEERASSLSAWGPLLQRLCGLVTDDGLTVPPPLGDAAQERLCECLAGSRPDVGELRGRLHQADAQPRTPWEDVLDGRVRRSAGDAGAVLTGLEMASDIVVELLARRRTDDALRCLGDLTAGERQRLTDWATQQAGRLGIPPQYADPTAQLGPGFP